MKTATALAVTLALAASPSTHATLTPFNTTYDSFTLSVFNMFGSAAEVIFTKQSPWLITTFNTVLTDIEAQLALGQQKYPYYEDRLNEFLDRAADYDDRFATLAHEYVPFNLSVPSLLGYAARPYMDSVFDTVEMILPALNNATLSAWHMRERQAMEKRVLNGTSTGLLAGKLSEYLMELTTNRAASTCYGDAVLDVHQRVQDEYEMQPRSDEDDEDEDEDASQ